MNKDKYHRLRDFIDHYNNIGSLTSIELVKFLCPEGNIVFFHTDVNNYFNHIKEASFSTDTGIELVKISTIPVLLDNNKSIEEMDNYLKEQSYSIMDYKNILDLGIIYEIKNKEVKILYTALDDHLIEINTQSSEEISASNIKDKSDHFWRM